MFWIYVSKGLLVVVPADVMLVLGIQRDSITRIYWAEQVRLVGVGDAANGECSVTAFSFQISCWYIYDY